MAHRRVCTMNISATLNQALSSLHFFHQKMRGKARVAQCALCDPPHSQRNGLNQPHSLVAKTSSRPNYSRGLTAPRTPHVSFRPNQTFQEVRTKRPNKMSKLTACPLKKTEFSHPCASAQCRSAPLRFSCPSLNEWANRPCYSSDKALSLVSLALFSCCSRVTAGSGFIKPNFVWPETLLIFSAFCMRILTCASKLSGSIWPSIT